jgi:DNA-binding transcriptional MocR family regulator
MAQTRYRQLVEWFSAEIRGGGLVPGARLPTHRELAQREGIALVTASRVYAELRALGLVSGETGRGTFVKEIALPADLGIDQHAVASDVVDLNFNYPALPGQSELLRDALRQLASTGDLESLLRYQPHGGRPHERDCVARHLLARGLSVTGKQLLLVAGAQHGLATTTMALLQPGDAVAVDAVTYPGFKLLAAAHRLELVVVRAAGQGPDPEHLDKLCRQRRIRAIYTMPTLQNPLGWVMSARHRRELVATARRHDMLIIEDAAYAFLVERAPPPLAAMAPERTVYVSGFSKNVATGLRVGFVVAPAECVPKIERAIRATVWNAPGVMTAITCGWIDDGTVERLEAQKRRDAKARQKVAAESLGRFPRVGHPASYFVWLPLAEDVRAEQVAAALMQERISVSTATPFAVSPQLPQAIRLALGSVDLALLPACLEKTGRVLDRTAF